MPYNANNDPYVSVTNPALSAPKVRMEIVSASNVDFDTYCLIYANAAGTVSYIPAKNADADVVVENVTQGWASPVYVRRVTSLTFSGGGIYKLLDK
jgi:hypothetical protein